MALVEQWIQRPQGVWLRKAFFQVHLWTGIGLGLYIFVVSISGSAIVFRTELSKRFEPQPKLVSVLARRLTSAELKQAAEHDHPNYVVSFQWDANQRNQATDVWMIRGQDRIQRQYDPYTGKDLGRSVPISLAFLGWMIELHGNLLAGSNGRMLNGVGAIFLVLLSFTGAIIWWPGIQTWRRSLTIDWSAPWKRLNWNLHGAVGFYMLFFVFVWGFTGAFLVFPEPFERTINFFSPLPAYRALPAPGAPIPAISNVPTYPPNSISRRLYGRRKLNAGQKTIRWMNYLHYGSFGGWGVKSLWVVLGLVPPFLFVTGALMWWNRVLGPYLRRRRSITPVALDEAKECVTQS
jgi:uncharacterized iron-regulated membrane protein